MSWFRRNRDGNPHPQVAGDNGFGWKPYQVVYDKRNQPDPGAPGVAFLTEQLPVEQLVGPAFFNADQMQITNRPTEMMIALQGVGIQTVDGGHAITSGAFMSQGLTNVNSVPGGIPLNANGPIGSFEIPKQ